MKNNIAVIFDMDGVIIDSNPLITYAWRNFFLQHDIHYIHLSPDQLANSILEERLEIL